MPLTRRLQLGDPVSVAPDAQGTGLTLAVALLWSRMNIVQAFPTLYTSGMVSSGHRKAAIGELVRMS